MNRSLKKRPHGKVPGVSAAMAPKVSSSEVRSVPLLHPLAEALIVCAFAIGLYVNTLNHGYALDDTMMITHNEYTQQGVAGLGKILTNDAFTGFHGEDKNLLPGGRYRPLSQMMFAVEFALFGMNPFPGHLINILMYALACLLVLRAMQLLFAGEPHRLWRFSLPFVVTLLFTLHPLHTEGVANIKGRDEILGLIGFAVLAILALRCAGSRRKVPLFLLAPVMVLSLLAKESALTYLAAIPLMVWYRTGRPGREVMQVLLSLGVGVVLYVVLRLALVGVPPAGVSSTELLNDPFLHANPIGKLATLFYTWIRYIALILFPHTLTHDYYPWHITYKTFGNGAVLLSLLIFAGMALYSVKKLRRPDIPATGFMLFVILFSSQSNLLVNIGAFMNERFVFVAMIGVIMLMGWLLTAWLPKRVRGGEVIALILLAVMVTGFSVKTVSRNSAWKDDYTLFTTDVKNSPNSAKVNISAGGKMLERALELSDDQQRGMLITSALPYLRRGVELHPGYLQGYIVLGNALFHLQDYTGAAEAYEGALRVRPGYADAITNMGVVALRLINLNAFPQAEKVYRTLLAYRPGHFDDAVGLTEALLNRGAFSEAESILDSLYQINPDHPQLNHLTGQLWGRYRAFQPGVSREQHQSYMLRATRYLERAVELRPDNYSMTENLAIVYGIRGESAKALELFGKALALLKARGETIDDTPAAQKIYSDDLARLYRNIGDTYRNRNNMQDALVQYHHALEHTPDDPVLLSMVADIHFRSGNRERARELLRNYLTRNPGDQRTAEMLRAME